MSTENSLVIKRNFAASAERVFAAWTRPELLKQWMGPGPVTVAEAEVDLSIGLDVSNTGYFVYANGATDRKAFDAQLEFELTLIPYTGHDDWIEGTLEEIHGCLNKNHVPAASHNCDYCRYRYSVADVTA